MRAATLSALGIVAWLVGTGAVRPQTPPVMLDGRFDDWVEAPIAIDDARDAPAVAVDFGRVLSRSDARWVYLAVDVGHEVTLQSLPGTVRLLVDADADEATGAAVFGMRGVDVAVDFSHIPRPEVERGAGVVILRAIPPDLLGDPIGHQLLGVTAAPVHASARYELRLSRAGSAAERIPPFGPDVRIKLVYAEDGEVRDETAVGRVVLDVRETAADRHVVDRPLDWIRRSDGTLRIAHWNVADNTFRARPEGFARLLAAVDPEILTLSELPGDVSEAEVQAFFDRAPLNTRGHWRFVLGRGGGRQRAVVAVRNLPLSPAQPLVDVRYPPAVLAQLQGLVPVPTIELEASRGLSAVGAWVDAPGGQLLVVSLDLQSAGWINSPQDHLRQVQARIIRDRIDDALAARMAPTIVGGDLNLVGSAQPLATLASSRHSGAHLAAVDARRLGERTLTTWRHGSQPFTPGRLDYVLVPAEGAAIARAFALTTEDLDADTLGQLGLEVGLSASVSDHLIVVADLAFEVRGVR